MSTLNFRYINAATFQKIVADIIAVRAVHSYDAMTAQAAEIPYSVLKKISERITRELKSQVNRVVYDITDKPPGTIEWE